MTYLPSLLKSSFLLLLVAFFIGSSALSVSNALPSEESHSQTYIINIPVNSSVIQQVVGPELIPAVFMGSSWISFEVFWMDYVKIKTGSLWIDGHVDGWIVKAKTYVSAKGLLPGQFIMSITFSQGASGFLSWVGCKAQASSMHCGLASSLINTPTSSNINTNLNFRYEDIDLAYTASLNFTSEVASEELFNFLLDHYQAVYYYDGSTTGYWNSTITARPTASTAKVLQPVSLSTNILSKLFPLLSNYNEDDINNAFYLHDPIAFINNDSPSLLHLSCPSSIFLLLIVTFYIFSM